MASMCYLDKVDHRDHPQRSGGEAIAILGAILADVVRKHQPLAQRGATNAKVDAQQAPTRAVYLLREPRTHDVEAREAQRLLRDEAGVDEQHHRRAAAAAAPFRAVEVHPEEGVQWGVAHQEEHDALAEQLVGAEHEQDRLGVQPLEAIEANATPTTAPRVENLFDLVEADVSHGEGGHEQGRDENANVSHRIEEEADGQHAHLHRHQLEQAAQ